MKHAMRVGTPNEPAASRREDGFSLVEMAIVTVILTVVLGSMVTVVFHSDAFSEEYTQQLVIDQAGRRVMERLVEDLRVADPTTLAPPIISDYVEFQKVTGYVNGAQVLGPVITISRTAVAEAEKSPKNQGLKQMLEPDGSVSQNYVAYDEGFLTYTESGQEPLNVVGKVLALRFEPLVGSIKISVDIGLVNRDGYIVQKTFSEQVAYRN